MIARPARLIRLYLDSRQTRRALVLIAATAAGLRASEPVTQGAGVFAQLTLMLLTLGAAAVIAVATHNPFGEAEHTSSSPLAALRLTQLALLVAVATAAVATAGWTATYGVSPAVILRNLAGFTGLALLTAAILGANFAWTVPLAYVMYCGGELDLQAGSQLSWPILPASNHVASASAAGLLIAGITAVTIAGARDHRGADVIHFFTARPALKKQPRTS
jgi:hypothetical protein